MTARRRAFLDTNVLVYLLTAGPKADVAERILEDSRLERVISTQVISEFVQVARRKGRLEWSEIRAFLAVLRSACDVETVQGEDQDEALSLAERHGFAWYDSLIVASALATGADTLLSEDFQAGMRIEKLRMANPFR